MRLLLCEVHINSTSNLISAETVCVDHVICTNICAPIVFGFMVSPLIKTSLVLSLQEKETPAYKEMRAILANWKYKSELHVFYPYFNIQCICWNCIARFFCGFEYKTWPRSTKIFLSKKFIWTSWFQKLPGKLFYP